MKATDWAVLIDLLLGEPPASMHPTVYMGKFIGRCKPKIRRRADIEFGVGSGITAAGMVGSWVLGKILERSGEGFSRNIQSIFTGAVLKPTLSLRPLLSAAKQIENALRRGNLDEGRRLLGWHLVSRDTSTLRKHEVIGATIESIAENLSDSFLSPLLMYRFGGLGAAYAYRFVNTADAMLGYRTEELEWVGKFAARTDDILNLVPARLSALCIALAAPLGQGSTRNAIRIALQDACRTTSPNAGWPMAAMAGAIGCRLTKRGVYSLHKQGQMPGINDLRRARWIVAGAAAIGFGGIR